MGTNYYAERDVIVGHGPVVSVERERLHIGKSSSGWCFSLHVIPEKGLNDLDDWVQYIIDNSCVVLDEYGEKLTCSELLEIITERKGRNLLSVTWNNPDIERLFGHSYTSLQAYLDSNHAIEGPNNLLRHKIDGHHCVGHGQGTWDLIAGDFC